MPFDWTEGDILMLKQWFAEGKSASIIAADFSRETGKKFTRGMVSGKLHRLGLKLNGKPLVSKNTEKAKQQAPKLKSKKTPPVGNGELTQVEHLKPKLVPFMDLTDKHCRWPCGEGLYCGLKVVRGSFCAAHAERCYNPFKGKGER